MLGMLVSGCFRNIGHLSVGQEGRLRGAMCYKLGETEEPQLKKQCMERWWQMVKEPWWSVASWQSYRTLKFRKKVDVSIFMSLACHSFIRMLRIITVLEPYLISIQYIIGQCKLIFNWASSIFFLIWATWFQRVWVLSGLCLKAYVLEVTGTSHIKHEFSNCRCDIVFIRCKDNFLTRGCSKNQILAVLRVWPLYGYVWVETSALTLC